MISKRKPSNTPFVVSRKAPNIFTVNWKTKSNDWTGWVLLRSDAHHDSPHSDHDMQKRHLDLAIKRGAAIIDCGDVFDLMQGKWDPRRSKFECRPEFATSGDYLDKVINNTADFLAPYSSNFVCIGRGNHEQSVMKNLETDVTERLCARMSGISGKNVWSSGYGGYVIFKVDYCGRSCNLILKHYHGTGGGGEMSKGTLSVVRDAAKFDPNSDIIAEGHIHELWMLSLERERLVTQNGVYKIETKPQYHLRCGSYKDEHGSGYAGWSVEKNMPPKSKGAWWVKLGFSAAKFKGEPQSMKMNVNFEIAT